jgi:hypothetical protein
MDRGWDVSADGTYSFAYCGEQGVGVGVVTIVNGILKGADLGGGRYSGVVTEQPGAGGYNLVYDMFIPASSFLVQGTAPQDMPQTRRDVIIDLPPDFANGEPIKLDVPPGIITMMIRRISDEYAWLASGAKLSIAPA